MNSALTALIVIMTCSSSSIFAQYQNKIRIMTYNINAEKYSDGSYDDIATVIKTINPDINGLQKIDSSNTRNPQYVLKWLGEQTGRVYTFAPAIKNYKNAPGSYGVGFLSKEVPLSVRRLWIEHTSSEEDRGVLEIGITMGGEKVRVIVTHLAHEGVSYRTAQINKIIPWIDSISKTDPVVILADFNAAPTETSMQLFETAGYLYVKGKNGSILDTSTGQKINHILYRPKESWNVADAENPKYAASNRNPVWADMELLTVSNYKLHNYSQPKNTQCQIAVCNNLLQYNLPHSATVSLSLFSSTGRKVAELTKNQSQRAGLHSFQLVSLNLPVGVYHSMLTIDDFYSTGKVMVLR
jgi:endonuclease/exonuclease/phosphatase family metal-dependent hydrolase